MATFPFFDKPLLRISLTHGIDVRFVLLKETVAFNRRYHAKIPI